MDITLTNIHGGVTSNATFEQIKSAYLELFRLKGSSRFCVTLENMSELELEIYSQSIVLTDFGRFAYDGPGGASELLMIRYEEGTVLPILEELSSLLEGDEREKTIELLKKLPKPKD